MNTHLLLDDGDDDNASEEATPETGDYHEDTRIGEGESLESSEL